MLLLSRRANQFRNTEVVLLTDNFLEDQNRCLADINLNLARLTRCNTFDDETVFNSYLENILATNYQFVGTTKDNDGRSATNESGFEEANDDDDSEEWTDIDDDEE